MGKGAAKKAEAAAGQQQNIAGSTYDVGKEVLAESKPARQAAMATYSGLAKGNAPGIQQYVAPEIASANEQFDLARRQIEAMPPGGARDAAMRELALKQAGTKTGIYSGGVREATGKLAELGWGGTTTGLGAYGSAGGGYGSAAGTYSALSASQAGAWSSLASGIGGMAGGLMSGGLLGGGKKSGATLQQVS